MLSNRQQTREAFNHVTCVCLQFDSSWPCWPKMKIQQSINVFTFETSEKLNNFQPYLWIWYFTSQNKRLENNMRRFQSVGLP